MQRKIVPDIIPAPQALVLARPDLSVRDAAALMAARNIGALMVVADNRLAGIFTERDMSRKVVAPGLDPSSVRLAEVMTRNPDTLAPDDGAAGALKLMAHKGYRHLPVVSGGEVVGIVSIRDLYAAVLEQMEDELRDRDAFITGRAYGAGV